MAREGEKRSHIRKRKKGCLTGCLTNILLVLGVAAAIFVGAHVLGFVKTDSTTGAPIISFDHIGLENLPETNSKQVPASLPPRAAISALHFTFAPEDAISFSPADVMPPITTMLVPP